MSTKELEQQEKKMEVEEEESPNPYEQLCQAMWVRSVKANNEFLEYLTKVQQDQINFYVEANKKHHEHHMQEMLRMQTSMFEALAKDNNEFKEFIVKQLKKAFELQGDCIVNALETFEERLKLNRICEELNDLQVSDEEESVKDEMVKEEIS